MPQQINLSSPLLLKPKQYLSAFTMVVLLTVFLVTGAAACAYWMWAMQNARQGYEQTLATQTHEIDSLQTAIKVRKASAVPADPALVAQALAQHRAVEQRKLLLQALQQGMFRPGEGHSDRLQLVASSIPAPVWVTEVKADADRFELSGFTLEPSALNEWVDKLALSPLMRGLRLDAVKVENAAATKLKAPTAVPTAPAVSSGKPVAPVALPRAVWSFNLVSVQSPAPVAAVINAAGSTP